MRLSKDELLTLFMALEDYNGATNSLEYVILSRRGIDPMEVINYLKSVKQYNGEDISDLSLCSFLDIFLEFVPEELWDEAYEQGYMLAADFLTSNFISDECVKDFLIQIVINDPKELQEESPECYKALPMEDKEIANLMNKIL